MATDFNYTCSNPACGKPFVTPLAATNLSQENPEPYPACPYCLMQLTTQRSQPTAETRLDARTTNITKETTTTAEKETKREPTKTRCNHHLGYLSERSNKEKIPEECITCADIINCMLKNLKDRKSN